MAALPGLAAYVLSQFFRTAIAVVAPRGLGRGLTLLNCASFTGAAVLQSVSGIVVRLSEDGGPEAAYRILFAFLAAVPVLALVTYARSADARRDGKPV